MVARRRHATRGLTMIELMVVLAIATVGLLGFVSMQRVAISGNLRSRNISEALALAQDKLEAYGRVPWAQLAAGVTVEPPGGLAAAQLLDSRGVVGPAGAYARTTIVAMSAASATLQVTVQFRAEDGTAHQLTVWTMRAPN